MMSACRRWLGLVAALLATVAFATSTAEAAPPADAIRGDVPTAGVGLGLLTSELTPEDVVASLAMRGCSARTIGAVQSGALRTYVAGAPAFVNAAFPVSLGANSPVLYVCDSTRPTTPVSAPTSSATSTPTATPTTIPSATTGVPRATLVFADSITPAEQAIATTQIKALEDYWEREVGLTFEGLTLVLATDFESELADRYATATRRTRSEAITRFNSERWTAIAIPRAAPDSRPLVLSIAKGWPTAPDDRSAIWVIAHEYFHLVQDRLSGARIGDTPLWAAEGSADYAAHRYIDTLTGNTTSLTTRLRPAAALTTSPISAITQICDEDRARVEGCHALDPYRVGSLAHAWLSDRTSAGAPAMFWRNMRTGTTWEATFQATYGMTPTDFYREFEAFRAESSPIVRGRLTLNGAVPGIGWSFYICRVDGPAGQSCPGVAISANGAFQMAITTAGSYRVVFDEACNRGGYLSSTGAIVGGSANARVFVLGGTAVTIPDVNFVPGPCVTTTGRVEDTAGRGISGVTVSVCFTDRCAPTSTTSTGAYTIRTPEGTGYITVISGKCAGWYYTPTGAIRFGGQATRLPYTAAIPPAPITFRIPPDATCTGG
jgi:hypothetical protein